MYQVDPVLNAYGARAIWVSLLTAAFLLSSCVVKNGTTVNWSSSVASHRYTAHYAYYNGTTSVPISIHESQVTFDYQATVDKGSLSIKLSDPGGHQVWETTLPHSGAGTKTVPISRFGSYSLRVDGQQTGGAFDITWQ